MGPSRYGHPEPGDNHSLVSPVRPAQNRDRQGAALPNIDGLGEKQRCRMRSKFYGQAERAISSGKLNRLPGLHIRPIKLVVFQCPC